MNVLFNKSHRPILFIMAALMVWGSVHALGAYLFEHDYRKPLVVYGFLLAFLGAWATMLAFRGRHLRLEQKRAMDAEPKENHTQNPDREASESLP